MLVDIFLCGLLGFLSIRLCEKIAFEYEKEFKICFIIVCFSVIVGFALCVALLIIDFNIINWSILTLFVFTIIYAFFSNSIDKLKNKQLFITCMFGIGIFTSLLDYSAICCIIKLIQL